MEMVKYCCYGLCNSDSRVGKPGYEVGVKFYSFPQPCLKLRDSVLTWTNCEQKIHAASCKQCSLCWKWMVRCKRKKKRRQISICTLRDQGHSYMFKTFRKSSGSYGPHQVGTCRRLLSNFRYIRANPVSRERFVSSGEVCLITTH